MRIHGEFRIGSNMTKGGNEPAVYGRPIDGSDEVTFLVSEAVTATGASAACLYLLSGQSIIRKLQFPAIVDGFAERIEQTADEPVSRCIRTGLDWCGQGTPAHGSCSVTEYTFPLFSGGETVGALVLRGVDTGAQGWNPVIHLLKEIGSLVISSSLRRSDAEAVREAESELSRLRRRNKSRQPAKNSLRTLAEWMTHKFGLSSISIITPLSGESQKICIAGSARDLAPLDDDVALSLREGRPVRKTVYNPASAGGVSLSIIPVGQGSNRIVALLEFKSAHDGVAEDIASRLFSAALELMEHEFDSDVFWADIIEAVGDAGMRFLRQQDSGTAEMAKDIFGVLVSKGYISGFSLLSAGETHQFDDGTGKPVDKGVVAGEAEKRTAAPSVSGSSPSLAIPIFDGRGNTFTAVINTGSPVLLQSEIDAWNRTASALGTLLRTFSSGVADMELAERGARTKKDMERLSGAYVSMFNAQSAREVVAEANLFMRLLDGMETAAYYSEGGTFHRLDDGNGARVVFSQSLLESMIASSRAVSRYIHRINHPAFSGVLSKIFPRPDGKSFHIMSAGDEKGTPLCFIVFAMPVPPSGKETIPPPLVGLSLFLNLRMILMGSLLAERTDSRLVDYVRELLDMISQAEDTNRILKGIVDASAAVTRSPMVILAVHNLASGGETFNISVGFKRLPGAGDVASLPRGIVGRALRSGEPEIVNDYPNDPDAVEEYMLTNNIERMACIPVNMGIKEKGYLAVMNTADRGYGQRHLKSLRTLSNLAALAIRMNAARMERALLLSDFDRLQDVEIALFSSRSMYALRQTLAMEMKTLVSATDVVLVSVIGATKRTVCSTSADVADGSVVYDGSIIGMQFDHQQHVTRIVETARMEEEWASRLNIRQVLMVKVRTDESMVIVAFNKSTGRSFDENDAEKVAKLSRIAAAAIDKVHLVERLNRQLKHIEIMHTIVNGVIQGRLEEDVMKEIVPKVVEMMDGDFGLLWKHNRDRHKNVVICEFYRTGETEHLLDREFDEGKGITGMVFQSRKPLLVTNAATDNAAVQIEGTKKQTFETIIATPLMSHDEMLGVLSVYRNTPPSFGTSELNLLASLSNDISLVMSKYSSRAKGMTETSEAKAV